MHTKSVPPSPGAAPLRWQHASAQELKEVKTRFHPDERIRATDTIMVMALALALAFACAPVAFAQPNSSDDADALRAEARRLSAAGATERALAAIRKAVSLRPNDPALHVELAGLLMVAGDNAAARVAVDDALKINPNYANAHQLLAALHRRAGDFESAIREAKLALSLKPDGDYHIGAHVTLGRSYKHLKRYSEAADEFREALRIEQLAFIHKELGDTLFRLEKT